MKEGDVVAFVRRTGPIGGVMAGVEGYRELSHVAMSIVAGSALTRCGLWMYQEGVRVTGDAPTCVECACATGQAGTTGRQWDDTAR